MKAISTPIPTVLPNNHFGLSGARGDDVWLVVPDGNGGIAMFVDDVHFGASLNDESFGRLPMLVSHGADRLVPLGRNSLGCRNTHAACRAACHFRAKLQSG